MIITYPSKILRAKCRTVNSINSEIRADVKRLLGATMNVDRWYILALGMAANQIGIDKRLVILRIGYNQYIEMINPEILSAHISFPSIEGCFSLPGKKKIIMRKLILKIKYQDVNGKMHLKTFIGPKAFVMQQEIDHLNGKLIID